MAGLIASLVRRVGANTRPAETAEPETAPGTETRALAEVEFAGYSEDCRVFGFFQHAAGRMTDALNDGEAYHLTDVMIVSLADGHAIQAKELTVQRAELLAVKAAGRRGEPGLRGRSRPYPVTLQSGPFTIHGYLHGLPGADPLLQLRRRPAMVALTESWIEYQSAGASHRARVGTIIVNREVLDWIRLSKDEEVGLPDLPAEVAPDPRAKDMTGYIRIGDSWQREG
ncbi:MAG: hypothetical protein AB1736_00490 [Chloroflexota bacterium]